MAKKQTQADLDRQVLALEDEARTLQVESVELKRALIELKMNRPSEIELHIDQAKFSRASQDKIRLREAAYTKRLAELEAQIKFREGGLASLAEPLAAARAESLASRTAARESCENIAHS